MKYVIDLNGVTTRQQFQELVVQSLPCPEYFGRNLDALYDVMTEWNEPTEIVFLQFQEFTHQMPGYAEAVENLCMDAMAENENVSVTFE